MKKSIIISLILVVLIGGFFLLHTREDSTEVIVPGKDQDPIQKVFAEQSISLKDGTTFSLTAPENYSITPVYEGFKRLRFMSLSPDGHLFVTDMYDLSDNTKGKIHVLEDFDPITKKFGSLHTYLENVRNPNSTAFYQDRNNQWWLYVALTDKLIRYKYTAGDVKAPSQFETIVTFPAYGLSYKYGGWHLTRTIAFHNDKAYVSVGSSCNSCEEIEQERASIIEMDPDGSNVRFYAKGLRNSVGIKWIGNDLYATGMGVDHLGPNVPNEGFYKIRPGTHYGWPYCYVSNTKVVEDTSQAWKNKNVACSIVPAPDSEFPAHAAPLGIELFDASFLVALHGSSDRNIGTGYKIVQISENNTVTDLISGFLKDGKVYGRPVDILKNNESSFFFTDDFKGVLYFVTVNK